MNSIKNAIVTVTLCIVGYGAYVVLNNPPERNFDQFASQHVAEIDAPGELPHVIGRAPFGRIAIANSDAGASPTVDSAIDQAHRAVGELASSA